MKREIDNLKKHKIKIGKVNANFIVIDGKKFVKLFDGLTYSEVQKYAEIQIKEGYEIVFSEPQTEQYEGFVLTTYSLFGYRSRE